ncbi:thiamine biosynthesis protein ApbE, partial [Rubrivivax gelatinosus]|nr:thiamine biosynthesis protein ApbE [Rubrivivax gelatinosus]
DAARWSRFRGDGELARLAAAAGAGAVRVEAGTAELLRAARRCAEATDGCFDPTVGAYEDWHFGDAADARVPDAVRLAAQRRLVGFEHLDVDRTAPRVRLARAGMRLDLGGFAKLPVLAAGLQAVQDAGIGRAMVNGGGDVLCAGQGADPAWRIGVRDPKQPARLLGVVALRAGVVASSGDYERCFIDAQGRRQHHILDPRSGRPSRGLHGVTLVADAVQPLNGLGTAIMVGGVRRAQGWLAARPGVDALAVGDGSAWFAGSMSRRLQPV